jgi:DNA repair protein RadC
VSDKSKPSVEYHTLIRDLPAAERPRERLRDFGAESLSNAELLAIILRTGAASESVLALSSRLLSGYGGLPGLARASFAELCGEHGLGEAKAAQLKAALELGKRLASTHPEERAVVRTPQDVFNLLKAEMGFLEQEHLRVVLLNTKNQVLGMPEVYRGSVSAAMVRSSELLREAVRQNCPAVIVVHNHPSGDPTPSPDDIAMTRKLVEAGKLLDIDVLDHIVIGEGRFVSMKERRLGFERGEGR